MNITVRNLPDLVYRVIKRQAKKNRRSLNAEIIQTLETEAAEAGIWAICERIWSVSRRRCPRSAAACR